MAKQHWLAALAGGAAWEWIKTWLWGLVPTVPAAITAVSGAVASFPIWAIILITAWVFWAVAGALRTCLDIAAKLGVRGRLIPLGPEGVHATSKTGTITELGMRLRLANTSQRLIQYKIKRIKSSIDGRINPAPTYNNMGGDVFPSTATTFHDANIKMTTLVAGKVYSGTFEVELEYGLPDNLKQELAVSYKVAFKAKNASEVEVFQWWNV